jgi:hypothetical protein
MTLDSPVVWTIILIMKTLFALALFGLIIWFGLAIFLPSVFSLSAILATF